MKKIYKIFFIFSVAILAACGGGGGSGGSNPNQSNFFTTAGASVTLPVSKVEQFEVGGGVPPYRVSTNDQVIAVGAVNGKVLTIGALAPGNATISVFDSSGASTSVSVRVGATTPLYTTASSSITIGAGAVASRVFTIGGGVAPYTVVGNADSVARVEVVGATQWKVTGIAIGATNVKIRDAAGVEVDVAVTVGAPALRVSPIDLKLFPGITAIVKISGGQPPYRVAGGIPDAVDAQISTTNPDELIIVGKLASKLDLSVADATGQLQKVTVEVALGQGSFGFSPSQLFVSENDNQPINLTIYGAAPGKVCLFTSDATFLKPAGDACKTVVAAGTPILVETGTSGSRCVTGDKLVTITAVDSRGAVGDSTIIILDNGINGPGCGSAAFAVSPTTLTLSATTTTAVAVVTGGSNSYVVTSSNPAAATVAIAGSVVTLTRVAAAVANPVVITIRDNSNPLSTLLLNVTVN